MKKFFSFLFVGVISLALVLSGCSSNSSSTGAKNTFKGPVKLGISSWIGFAPMYLAEQKGFFKKHGVNVELQTIQSAADRRTAMAANRIQGFMTTVDTHVMTAAAKIPVDQVLALDTSSGGDGIVAKNSIKTFQDLKGKRVAIDTSGGASYFWFMYMLDQKGMSLSDVTLVNMSAGDAGAAFVGGKVDAAVTWQPWLTKAEKTSFGHVLLSSDKTPGLIVDSLGLRKDFIKNNPKLVQGIVDAWYEALSYAKSNPDDANKIMAKSMGQTVSDFTAEEPDVTFYDKAGNVKYFGTKSNPGLIYDVTDKAATFWKKVKLINVQPKASDLIDGSFVGK
ncbi:aliphatic sulfonate ABC transporter substrate-binding protein [Sporolactobacillus shoreae]|uniref:Aliphatic sulfonate ABC transporter substrate-binding protein n=1 Tax=Sporolactobacillus shoreae TaxID=1465501 RepID=A0A4Z0GR34_9BACL|nr:ABC transporter substrate-binding protein [Sporolactobacillus shoreae]TGA99800.1 aliphatic sulfonate ABC transporter substrate-binding protein [Sporolactobacillus shoreae]